MWIFLKADPPNEEKPHYFAPFWWYIENGALKKGYKIIGFCSGMEEAKVKILDDDSNMTNL